MSRRAQAGTLFLLAVVSMASATAAPLYGTAADRAVVADEVRTATAAERSITFTAEVSAVSGYSSSLEDLRGQVRSMVGSDALTQVTGVRVAGSAGPTGQSETSVVMRDDACGHLRLLQGHCPTSAGQVYVSELTARQLGLRTGSALVFRAARSGRATRLRVSGVYDSAAARLGTDPYWAGRVDLVPNARRDTGPMFVAGQTIDTLGAEKVVAMVDLYAEETAFTADNAADIATSLDTAQLGAPGITVTDGLRELLERIQVRRDALGLSSPLGAVQLLVVSWFVLLMVVSYTAAARRTELAIGTLRGAPARHRVLLATGPTALVLVLAAPFGLALGWLMVRTLTWGTPASSAAMPLDHAALLTAGGTLLALMASAAIAERRALSGSLVDALRQVPARRRRPLGLIELAATVVALAAVGQSYTSAEHADGLALMVPLLLALMVGLLTARLVRPVASAFGAARLHRGSLASGQAALRLARQPGTGRLVALTVVAVSLVGYTVSAWNVAGSAAHQRAELDLGASRVITVDATSSPVLVAAVHKADPDGAWAMAATRLPGSGTRSVAVESARLAAVSLWPDRATLSPEQTARAMRLTAADPVMVNGSGLELGVNVVHGLDSPMRVIAVLTGPDGEPVSGAVDIAEQAGPARYLMALPPCAVAPGCRLGWLQFPRSPDAVQLTALNQQGPHRALLSGEAIGSASRWRPDLGSEHEVTVVNGTPSRSYVSLRYSPSNVHNVSTDIRLYVNDGPLPLPVVAAGPQRLAHTRELTRADPLSGRSFPTEVRRVSPVLPGVAADGLLLDLEYADRLGDGGDSAATLQVWLNDRAPADAVERLVAAGIVPLRDESVQARVAEYQQQGPALALRLQLAATVLGVMLVCLALLMLAATDRRGRAAELAAMRVQGLSGSTTARAAQLGNLAMIAIASPVGALTAAASWMLSGPVGDLLVSGDEALPLPGPDLGIVASAVLGATAVLLLAAWLAGRSLTRATARLVEDGAEVGR